MKRFRGVRRFFWNAFFTDWDEILRWLGPVIFLLRSWPSTKSHRHQRWTKSLQCLGGRHKFQHNNRCIYLAYPIFPILSSLIWSSLILSYLILSSLLQPNPIWPELFFLFSIFCYLSFRSITWRSFSGAATDGLGSWPSARFAKKPWQLQGVVRKSLAFAGRRCPFAITNYWISGERFHNRKCIWVWIGMNSNIHHKYP